MSLYSKQAMTFIEVFISILVISIVMVGFLTTINFADRYIKHTTNITMAINYAQDLMEEILNKDYEDIYAKSSDYHNDDYTNFFGPEYKSEDNADDDVDDNDVIERNEFDDMDDYNGYTDTIYLYQNENVNINATRTVVIKDQNENNILDQAEYLAHTQKQISVTVTWIWEGKTYTEKVDTIMAYWRNL